METAHGAMESSFVQLSGLSIDKDKCNLSQTFFYKYVIQREMDLKGSGVETPAVHGTYNVEESLLTGQARSWCLFGNFGDRAFCQMISTARRNI